MENPRPEKENITKDVRILFRWEKPKKETIHTTIKDIRNPLRLEKEKTIKDRTLRDVTNTFRLEKENEAIKNILSDIRNLFENEEEKNYYKLV